MRYRVSWQKECKAHHLLTGDIAPGEALNFAWALLSELHPSDIWIETEGGRRVAGYADIVEEGPLYSAGWPPPMAGEIGLSSPTAM